MKLLAQHSEKTEYEPCTFSFTHRELRATPEFKASLLTKDDFVQSGETITARCWHFLFL